MPFNETTNREARRFAPAAWIFTSEGIAGAYLAASVLWIVFSDRFVAAIGLSIEAEQRVQSVKGLGFVVVTAIGLYLVLKHWDRRRIAAEHSVAETAERFRELSEKTDHGFWFAESVPLKLLYVSRPFESIWRIKAEDFYADPSLWQARIHPEDRDYAIAATLKWLASGTGKFDITYRLLHEDGTIVWVQNRGTHIRPGRNGKGRIAGISEDVTERIDAEQHQRMLMDELDHRVKNNLAAVLSVLHQTLDRCGRLEEFKPAFTGRIEAMARTHSLLAAERWQGIEMSQMALATLEPHGTAGERIVLRGETLTLPMEMAQPLCMVLHELATNAAKYGALATPDGRVDVSWALQGHGDEANLVLEWKEHVHAQISPPTTVGFGLQFIEGVIRHELRGQARIDFEPDGLRCSIRAPINAGRASPSARTTEHSTQGD